MADASAFDPAVLGARRLGWFGGSFDPVHRGHLHVARTALAAGRLDHLVWAPAARSPHKHEQPTSAAERRRMLELALEDAGQPLLACSSIWMGEVERGGASFTVESLRAVARARGHADGLHLLLGSDQLEALDRWREIGAILDLVRPLVVLRPGHGRELLAALEGRLERRHLERLEQGFLEPEPVDLAASELRARLGVGAALEPDDLSPSVRRFVAEHGLYRDLVRDDSDADGPAPGADGA